MSFNWEALTDNPLLLLVLGATISGVIILIGISSSIVLIAGAVMAVICVMVVGMNGEMNDKLNNKLVRGLVIGTGGIIASATSIISPNFANIFTGLFLLILVIGSSIIVASHQKIEMVEP
jgi:hypothetical protein